MKFSAILIGLAAGAAAALLFVGLIFQSPTAVFLSLTAPVPIYIASLGWGSRIGFLAAAAAGAALSGLTGAVGSGIVVMALMTLPAAIVGHLAGLARPNPSLSRNGTFPTPIAGPLGPALDWYPLERVLLAIVASSIVASLFIGWMIGYDQAVLGPEIAKALINQLAGSVNAATEQQIRDATASIVRIVPYSSPALLVVVLVVGLYVSAFIVRLSHRLPRPKDDIPAAAGLPKFTLPVFTLALLACFAPGAAGLVAAVVTGSLAAGFTLVGLASVHRRTRASRHRGLLLIGAYAALLFLQFPLVAMTVLGLFETAKRPTGPAVPTSSTHS